MGDRANIVIQTGIERVWLYSHWDGYQMPLILRDALAKRERWDDPQYLARIVFQRMLNNDKSTTGYGISASMGDNSSPVLVCDTDNQRVLIENLRTGETKTLTMEAFASLTDEQCYWSALASQVPA